MGRRAVEEELEEDLEEDELEEEGGDVGRVLGTRGLAFGFLAMAPLFALYEVGIADGSRRAAAELLVTRPLAPFGEAADAMRIVGWVGLAIVSLAVCLRRHWRLGPSLLRVPVEGLLAALLLGPATALAMQVLGVAPLELPAEELGSAAAGVPDSTRAAFVAGAAAWEEILFRVGAFALVWTIVRRVGGWLTLSDRSARWSAEVAAPLGSALLFAAFHLDSFLRPFGPGGEPFDAGVFAWRTTAGVWLALLFRWRGPGVAAWAHATFNVALLLGAGPRVFL